MMRALRASSWETGLLGVSGDVGAVAAWKYMAASARIS